MPLGVQRALSFQSMASNLVAFLLLVAMASNLVAVASTERSELFLVLWKTG